LSDIENTISDASRTIYGRRHITELLCDSEYLKCLLPMMEICEDLENFEDLYKLSNIIRNIIYLNDADILTFIIQDEVFPIILGILECNVLK
jgi:hypothetical protein